MDFTNLKRFMDEEAQQQRTPGHAISVYLGGQQVFSYASGYADLETKTPLTGEEMFNIYSCSKVATVTAGVQLLEKGYFLLSDPLYDFIPEYNEMYVKTENGELVKAKNAITIGDLFSMKAGLHYDLESEGLNKARQLTGGKMNTLQAIRCLASDPLSFEPGAHWQYSLCHDVLAAVIEVITGKKFRDYVKENIFDPLKMESCVFHHTPEVLGKMASQYVRRPIPEEEIEREQLQTGGRVKRDRFVNYGKGVSHILGEEYDSGGAGIITTTADYVKLLAALANRGVGATGEKILSGYTIDLMRTDRLTSDQRPDFCWGQLRGCGYGLGVYTHIDPVLSGTTGSLGQFGWDGAAGSMAVVDPAIGLSFFYAQHLLNPDAEYYHPRLKNVVYGCLD